jgi:hypothetical protein
VLPYGDLRRMLFVEPTARGTLVGIFQRRSNKNLFELGL